MIERKEGWYWVRDGQGWEPIRWSGCVWDGHFNDADLEEIGPRIPTPDEPWQCVPKEPTRDMTWIGYNLTSSQEDAGAIYKLMLTEAPKPEDV